MRENYYQILIINPLTSPGEGVTVYTSPYLSAGAPALGEAKGLIKLIFCLILAEIQLITVLFLLLRSSRKIIRLLTNLLIMSPLQKYNKKSLIIIKIYHLIAPLQKKY